VKPLSEGGRIRLHLVQGRREVALLRRLVGELRTLVDAPPPSDDPLDNWAAELAARPIDYDDPVIRRLFPGAYDSPELDAEYRRLTEAGLRASRDADARIVERDLAAVPPGARHVDVARADAWAWLRTLNVLRLALAVRLEIADDADAADQIDIDLDDPRSALAYVYHWLGFMLESLLERLTGGEDAGA
jgi:hypothetical protein